ncbi:Ldh family oxidoreductase [Nonomuraea salmonea]|uniref:Ldh family oxidoreductase n=1 Tax=Nonomuraea salmonea TaxID=46181 RepID=UPI002FE79E78
MLTLSDVVLTLGTAGNERVLLRGADLSVAGGDTVLLTGLDAPARRAMADLLAGRIRPAYGSVTLERGDAGRTVLDAGDEPSDGIWQDLGGASPPRAVVVLAGRRPAGWPDRYRCLELRGGRFVPGRAGATVRVPLALLEQRIRQALTEAGAPPAASASVARVLVDAECRGHRSHGVALLPTYLRRIGAGGIVAGARPALTEVTGSLAVVDAGGGFGQPAMDVAAEWCAAAAAATGVAAVAVHNNNHVGMLAAYRWPFQRDDVVGLLMNTSGPSVSAPGAAYPTLGSNALCLVTPGAAGEPFCIDLATGVVAAGKIRDAANLGVPVPEAWLRDAAGRPTTDPDELDRGGSIPLFGGYKGLCVTLIVEILAGGRSRAGGSAPMWPSSASILTRSWAAASCSSASPPPTSQDGSRRTRSSAPCGRRYAPATTNRRPGRGSPTRWRRTRRPTSGGTAPPSPSPCSGSWDGRPATEPRAGQCARLASGAVLPPRQRRGRPLHRDLARRLPQGARSRPDRLRASRRTRARHAALRAAA